MKKVIEELLPLEREWFIALNGSESVWMDNLMWTVTGRFVWFPLFLLLLFFFFYKVPRKEALLTVVFFILLVVLCDQVSSGFLKPLFQRLRPTHHPDFQYLVDIVNDYRGGRYGFVSGHATNSFGMATFLALLYKSRLITFTTLFWAALNSYSRIYLGVHFISDIIGGLVLGCLLAFCLFALFRYLRRKWLFQKAPALLSEQNQPFYYHENSNILAACMIAYIGIVAIFSPLLSTLPH